MRSRSGDGRATRTEAHHRAERTEVPLVITFLLLFKLPMRAREPQV